MSSFMNLCFLDEIKPYKNKWRIQVKVLHSWKAYVPGVGESLELILSDAHGTKIHASCKKTYLDELVDQVPVGSWRNIENFSVTTDGSTYKSTNHAYKLSFLYNTAIQFYYIQQIEDPELPSEIVEIVGKTYGFGISGNDENNGYGAETFEAMKVWNLDDILRKRSKSLHQLSMKKQCLDVTEIDKNV